MLEILKNVLQPEKDFIYGFADLRNLLNEEFNRYSFGISIGKRLDNNIVDTIENGPRLEYLDHNKDINNDLANIATNICDELRKEKVDCISVVPTIPTASEEFKPYLNTLRYKLSHKMIATRAGLGWIGKADLFISNAFGPRVRLVSILIDKPIQNLGNSIDKSKCGKCNICVEKCPANAANGRLWDIYTDRDEFFDAHKCREKCGELGKLYFNKDVRICGLCVAVCPIGKRKN